MTRIRSDWPQICTRMTTRITRSPVKLPSHDGVRRPMATLTTKCSKVSDAKAFLCARPHDGMRDTGVGAETFRQTLMNFQSLRPSKLEHAHRLLLLLHPVGEIHSMIAARHSNHSSVRIHDHITPSLTPRIKRHAELKGFPFSSPPLNLVMEAASVVRGMLNHACGACLDVLDSAGV